MTSMMSPASINVANQKPTTLNANTPKVNNEDVGLFKNQIKPASLDSDVFVPSGIVGTSMV